MFWGSLVGKNALFCTVAGVVADWWYNGACARALAWLVFKIDPIHPLNHSFTPTPIAGANAAKGAVRRSFLRATTTSFGSICFGSLILAVLRATREMVKAADRDDNRGNNAARAIVQVGLNGWDLSPAPVLASI